jgi:hypothetical protein
VICHPLLKQEQMEVASGDAGQPLSMAFGCMRRKLVTGTGSPARVPEERQETSAVERRRERLFQPPRTDEASAEGRHGRGTTLEFLRGASTHDWLKLAAVNNRATCCEMAQRELETIRIEDPTHRRSQWLRT